ncbi:MAG: FeoB-associated Cys-rich membrane protein [Treponema sp.]|nr:FeoB-associated Cys-rich membrane protein [Treponema sp.]
MVTWFIQNSGTILITLVLILVVGGVISSMIKDKKHGKSTCGGNCSHCRMCSACKKEEYKSVI